MPQINKTSKDIPRHSEEPSVSRKKPRRRKKDPTEGLMVENPNAAAIDIGSSEHWVAVPPGRTAQNVRRFGCCTVDLERLAKWLEECKVDTVVLEATGHYWMVLYDLLEAKKLRPIVVNPRYAKNMSGKKGDIPDCQWMQKLHTYGLFSNSFRPPESVRALRAVMRQRENLVAATSQSIQHMQKALTEMNVQLTNVISDISGETGLRIIDAILAGVRDPEQLAALKDPRIKASRATLAKSLRGHWKNEQLFILKQARGTYAHYQEQILQCSQQIEQLMAALPSRAVEEQPESTEPATKPKAFSLKEELRRILGVDLTLIPGIGPIVAQIIVSEVGPDVSAWRTDRHFSSWLGVCPDHRITGGKIFSRSTRPVVQRLRNALRMAAYTLDHSHSALGAKYRRLKRRLGAPKAIVAMANHLAKLIYRMIKFGSQYVERGMEYYESKFRAQQRRRLEKQATELGLKLVEVEVVA